MLTTPSIEWYDAISIALSLAVISWCTDVAIAGYEALKPWPVGVLGCRSGGSRQLETSLVLNHRYSAALHGHS